MGTIAARDASEAMKLFLVAMACPPTVALKRAVKRRVWRSGPIHEPPPTHAGLMRQQLRASAHAAQAPKAGARANAMARRWSNDLVDRSLKALEREEQANRLEMDSVDLLVREHQHRHRCHASKCQEWFCSLCASPTALRVPLALAGGSDGCSQRADKRSSLCQSCRSTCVAADAVRDEFTALPALAVSIVRSEGRSHES